jgi:hypothetical protein
MHIQINFRCSVNKTSHTAEPRIHFLLYLTVFDYTSLVSRPAYLFFFSENELIICLYTFITRCTPLYTFNTISVKKCRTYVT